MTLPKILHPIYDIKVPSLKKSFKFRPFLVKEEKILLMAIESENPSDYLTAMVQIVNNCSIDDSFDLKKLAIFDLEYVFLKLRAHSVDNMCKVTYEIGKDEEKEKHEFMIDLYTVEVKFPDKIDPVIKINDNMGIIMKYPAASLYDDQSYLDIKKEALYETILRCIDKIYEGDNIIEAKDYKIEEISELVENLTTKVYDKIVEFLKNIPKLHHELKYKNKQGEEKTITLNALSDFFTLR